MTKKKFLEEVKKHFCNVSQPVEEHTAFPDGTREYFVIVKDIKDTLYAEYPLHFFVKDEGTSDERAFTPYPSKEKMVIQQLIQEKFNEKLEKKVELFRLL